MASFQAKGKTADASKFMTWPKVTTPDGRVFYKSPDYPGYVYDPVHSSVAGGGVYLPDPSIAIADQQTAKDQAAKDEKLKQQALSPAGQITPVVAATGLSVAGAYLANSLNAPKVPSSTVPVANPSVVSTSTNASSGSSPAVPNVAGAAATPASGNSVAQVLPPGQSPPPGMEVVGETSDGGTMVAPQGAQIAASDLGSLAAQAGVVLQAVRLGQQGMQAYNEGRGQGAVGGAKAGVKGSGGFLDTIQNLDPFAFQARLFGGALGGIFGSLTTTQTQNKRWNKLAEDGAITPEQLAAKQADLARPAKQRSIDPTTGQRWNLDTAMGRVAQGGTAADEFALTLAPHKTYGVDWQNYTPDQQRQILAANAQAGNYSSNKGDVFFADEAKAKQIKDQVLSGGTPVGNTPATIQQTMRTGRV